MKNWFIYSLIVVLFSACGSTNTITKEDLSFLYDRNTTKLRLPARVYQKSATESEVHFKLMTSDLLYRRGGEGDPFATLVEVSFDAYDASDRKVLLDSATVFVTDLTEDPLEEKELYGSLPMKRFKDKDVLIIMKAHDLYRDVKSIRRFEIGKQNTSHRNDFILIDPDREVPLLRDQLSAAYPVFIKAEQYKNQTLVGTFHKSDENIPPPVFSTRGIPKINETTDSTFTLKFDESGTAYLAPKQRGIYMLRVDTTQKQGLAIPVLGASYPKVNSVNDMIAPLRFITSKDEFEKIKNSNEPREELEKLWIDLAGNKERARQVIRAYYERVENANSHFTSFKEGWRTDRGLVHIVFGIPNSIHKSTNAETWIYGEESSPMSLTFVFVKRNTIFSDNELRLERDPAFKSAWYRNVESWRNGRVYEQ